MGRTPCCNEVSLKKGPWTTEEDQKLVDYISKNGHRSWNALPKLAGLNRCGKSCRLRWTNYLRPDIKRGKFSEEEERQIIEHHSLLGNKWSAIAARLPGRTDNEIKNYWNTHLRKKLSQMGIDPITHRPRLDLSLLANLPNLLASATNSSVTNLDCALRLQADVAQQARVQLFQALVQVLAGGGGSTSTINAPAKDFTSLMEPTGFLHNHQSYRGLHNVNSMDLLQVPNQTTKLQNSLQSLGGEEFVSLINGGSFLNTLPGIENNFQTASSIPSLVSASSENLVQTASSIPSLVSASSENLVVDQIKDLQQLHHNISENPSATTICESLDLDDLSGESYWREVLNNDIYPQLGHHNHRMLIPTVADHETDEAF